MKQGDFSTQVHPGHYWQVEFEPTLVYPKWGGEVSRGGFLGSCGPAGSAGPSGPGEGGGFKCRALLGGEERGGMVVNDQPAVGKLFEYQ